MLGWMRRHVPATIGAALGLVIFLYQFGAYTSDAYVTTDVVIVAPEVAGRLAELRVQTNQIVAAAEPLFVIEPRAYQIAVNAAEAELQRTQADRGLAQAALAEAQAGISEGRARLEDAAKRRDRVQTLAVRQDIAQQAVEDATRDYVVAEAVVARAQAQLASSQRLLPVKDAAIAAAEAALDKARYDLERTTIKAPAAGKVAPFKIRGGDYLGAGQAVLAIVTDTDWHIVANLEERYLSGLEPGKTALFMMDSDPWRVHRGRVRAIAQGIARSEAAPSALPYVAPSAAWIRLPRRFPVQVELGTRPGDPPLYLGADARVLFVY